MVSTDRWMLSFGKHKDIAYLMSVAFVFFLYFSAKDLIQNHTFSNFITPGITALLFMKAYIFTKISFTRQVKVYTDGISMPDRSILFIILGLEGFIPLEKITKCSLRFKYDKRVFLYVHRKNGFRKRESETNVGKQFLLDFIQFAEEEENWKKILHIEPGVRESLQELSNATSSDPSS